MQSYNFLLVGVGGQGTLLASNILAETGLALGYDVKKAEVHGMSQRGGSVVSHVRWAEKVFAPIIAEGEADIIIAFEKLEAARYVHFLRKNTNHTLVLINNYRIVPLTVRTSNKKYISDDELFQLIQTNAKNLYFIDGEKIGNIAGNIKTNNVAVLGALSCLLYPCEIDEILWKQPWIKAIEKYVPIKAKEVNVKAFELGYQEIVEQKTNK